MKSVIFPLLCLAFLCSCAAASDYRLDEDPPSEVAVCAAKHGRIEQVGFLVKACVYASTDNGRPCTDNAQCEGRCEVPHGTPQGSRISGACSALVGRAGCANLLVGGEATGDLCAD